MNTMNKEMNETRKDATESRFNFRKSLKCFTATLLVAAAVASFGTSLADGTHTADFSDTHTDTVDGVTTTTIEETGVHDSTRISEHGAYVTKDSDGNTIIGDGLNYTMNERVSAMHAVVIKETENAQGIVDMTVGNAEFEAGVQVGTYRIVDKDGNVSTGVGVKAEAEASAYVAQVKGEGRLGSEDNNVKGDLDIKCIGAETKAGVEVGIVNGQLVASGEVGANANLVKIDGSVGGTIAGVEAKVGGSVEIGVGAKAKAEFKDGKLEFEVGASLGIGGSVKASVDVDAIADKAVDGANALDDLVHGRDLNPLYGKKFDRTTLESGSSVKVRSQENGNCTLTEYKDNSGHSMIVTTATF